MIRPVRALPTLLLCLLLALCLGSCRPPASTHAAVPPHIRVEPSTREGKPVPTAGVATPQEMEIAFYPGAQVETSSLVRGARGMTGAVTMATRDAYAEVLGFYRRQYEPRGAKVVDLSGPDGRATAINWQTRSGNCTVTIKQDMAAKRTIISLVRTSQAPTPGP